MDRIDKLAEAVTALCDAFAAHRTGHARTGADTIDEQAYLHQIKRARALIAEVFAAVPIPPSDAGDAVADPKATETKLEWCEDVHDDWACSLPAGHSGLHKAYDEDDPPLNAEPLAAWPQAPEVGGGGQCASGPDCPLCAPRRVFEGFVNEQFWDIGEVGSGKHAPSLVDSLGDAQRSAIDLDQMFHDLHGERVRVTVEVLGRLPPDGDAGDAISRNAVLALLENHLEVLDVYATEAKAALRNAANHVRALPTLPDSGRAERAERAERERDETVQQRDAIHGHFTRRNHDAAMAELRVEAAESTLASTRVNAQRSLDDTLDRCIALETRAKTAEAAQDNASMMWGACRTAAREQRSRAVAAEAKLEGAVSRDDVLRAAKRVLDGRIDRCLIEAIEAVPSLAPPAPAEPMPERCGDGPVASCYGCPHGTAAQCKATRGSPACWALRHPPITPAEGVPDCIRCPANDECRRQYPPLVASGKPGRGSPECAALRARAEPIVFISKCPGCGQIHLHGAYAPHNHHCSTCGLADVMHRYVLTELGIPLTGKADDHA